MKDGFIKFKKKILFEAIIKSIIIGFCFGLISFSVPYLVIKIKGIEFNLLFLILIALGVFIIIGGLVFLIKLPTKMKVAKRIDKELGLKEKVQTMVEYENEDSFMINYQRETTLDLLNKTSIKSLSIRFSFVFIIVVVLALSVCVTALAVPGYVEDVLTEEPTNPDSEKTPDEPVYEVDDWTIKAILDIIEVVKNSNIDERLKTTYIDLLTALITALEETDKNSEVLYLVETVIKSVEFTLDIVNTNNEISVVLRESKTIAIDNLATHLNELNSIQVYNLIDSFKVLLNGSQEAIVTLDDDFGLLLRKSQLNKEDKLFILLNSFADEINKCALSENIAEDVARVVDNYREDIKLVVELQAGNKKIADYIVDELKKIFEISDQEVDSEETPSETIAPEDPEDEETQGDNSGGYGSGEVLFGSDDAFFDPVEGKVVFGDVFSKYHGNILTMIKEGKISEEMIEYLNYYFDILDGDINKEDNLGE